MIGPFEEVSRLDDDMYHETLYTDDAWKGGLTLNHRHPGLLHELVLFRSIFFLNGFSSSNKYLIGGALLATALLFASATMADRPEALMP